MFCFLQEQRDRRKMTCAVDGSVYKLYPYFKQRMEEALAVICGKYDIELIGADDGSGVPPPSLSLPSSLGARSCPSH